MFFRGIFLFLPRDKIRVGIHYAGKVRFCRKKVVFHSGEWVLFYFNIKFMKMKWCILSGMIISLFLSGCKHDSERTNFPGQREIVINYSVNQLNEVSRSGYAGMTAGDVVHLYIAERINAETPALPEAGHFNKMSCSDGSILQFADGGEHLYPEMPIDLYAFYLKGLTEQQEDVTRVAVEVRADQHVADAELASDFLYAKAADGYQSQEEAINLVFRHQFARVRFTITTDTPSEVDLETLEAVEIRNLVMDGYFNVQTGVLTPGETSDKVSAWIPEDVSTGVTAIVIPQTVAGGNPVFYFKVGAEEFVYNAPSEGIVFEAGKQYNYEVCLNRYAGLSPKEVQLALKVEDWNEIPAGSITIAHGEEVAVALTDVADGVTIEKADLYFSTTSVMGVAVSDNQMKFMFPRLVVDGTATLERAHFYTSTGEEFDYYFDNLELKGNGRDKVSVRPLEIGDCWGEGTVFVVGEVTGFNEGTGMFETNQEGINAYRGRIVADKAFPKTAWTQGKTVKGYKELMGMSDKNDGAKNWLAMKTFILENGENPESYPLYNALKEKVDWYVPALNEMICILANREKLNEAILAGSGDEIKLPSISYVYTTSTEYVAYKDDSDSVDSMCVLGLNSDFKIPSAGDKVSSGNLRLVKAF